jgi:predicted ATPase
MISTCYRFYLLSYASAGVEDPINTGIAGQQFWEAQDFARLWKARDKAGQARELLGPVYQWFIESFDTADLRQAKELLEELT